MKTIRSRKSFVHDAENVSVMLCSILHDARIEGRTVVLGTVLALYDVLVSTLPNVEGEAKLTGERLIAALDEFMRDAYGIAVIDMRAAPQSPEGVH